MPEPTPTAGPVAPVEFLVPDLGEGLEEATIVEWLVAEGEPVALNQPLCTLETAKAEVEVPSPHAGTVVTHGGAELDTLPVGSLLAAIDRTDYGVRVDLKVRQRDPCRVVRIDHDRAFDFHAVRLRIDEEQS